MAQNRSMRRWALLLFIVTSACSSSGAVDPAEAAGEKGGSAGSGSNGDAGTAGNAGSAGGVQIMTGDPTDCGDVGKVIFVVSDDYTLLKFDPATLTFSTIGKISCPAGISTPFSMAVDRNGVAFVLYQSGEIFQVSTENAACKASGYQANQLGWQRFGMGY